MLLPTAAVGAVALQPEVPLLLYSTVALPSAPLTVSAPLLVILSVSLVPVSVVRATVGAATVVSMVKASVVALAPTLPAVSVWRTVTDLTPSPVKVKLVPVPAIHVVPASVLYFHVAPVSKPLTLTVPTLVMVSVARPLLVAKASVGATGGVVSELFLEAATPTTARPASTPP